MCRRQRISGADSISLLETVARSRAETATKRAHPMKRSMSAKLPLNELTIDRTRPVQDVKQPVKQHEIKDLTVMPRQDVTKTMEKCNELRPSIVHTNVTVDTSKAKSNSDVIRLCLAELGWQEYPKGGVDCDIVWQSCTTSHEGRDSVNPTPNSNSIVSGTFTSTNSYATNTNTTLSTTVINTPTTRINKFPGNSFSYFNILQLLVFVLFKGYL